MQKNKKVYSFLLSHSTKSKIYIRRIEVSRKLLHSTVAGLILIVGIGSFGIISFNSIKNTVFAKSENTAQIETASSNNSYSEPKSINYSRPAVTENFSFNSGGPVIDSMSNVEESASEDGLEDQIRMIRQTANPAFLPTMWAHLGKINNEFGFRRNPFGGRSYEFHAGMDIDGERGDEVIAPANGTVIKAGWTGGYGNMIEIDHGNGLTTRYGHLSKIDVEVGDVISRGQLIGLIGTTGRSTGPHLHYELRLNDKSINPRWFLPPEPAEINN